MKLNLNRKGLGIILGLSLASGAAFATLVGVGRIQRQRYGLCVGNNVGLFGTAALPPLVTSGFDQHCRLRGHSAISLAATLSVHDQSGYRSRHGYGEQHRFRRCRA